MHEVQARTRLLAPLISARTVCRFTFHRRLVMLWAWLTLCPNCGPLPQISQTLAINSNASTAAESAFRSSPLYIAPAYAPAGAATAARHRPRAADETAVCAADGTDKRPGSRGL